MRYLFYLNCAVMALAAVLATVLAVVCLIYVVYLDREAQLGEELGFLVTTTVIFTVTTAGAALAVVGQYRKRPWHWAGLALWLASIGLVVRLFSPS